MHRSGLLCAFSHEAALESSMNTFEAIAAHGLIEPCRRKHVSLHLPEPLVCDVERLGLSRQRDHLVSAAQRLLYDVAPGTPGRPDDGDAHDVLSR
jgi:hypothetical protein